jgi:hypothetical protein
MTRTYVKLQDGEDYWCSEPAKNNSALTGDNAQTTTDGIIFHNVNFLILIQEYERSTLNKCTQIKIIFRLKQQ